MIKNISELKEWRNDERRIVDKFTCNGYTLHTYYSGFAVYKGDVVNIDSLVCTFMGFYEEEMYAAIAAILSIPNT